MFLYVRNKYYFYLIKLIQTNTMIHTVSAQTVKEVNFYENNTFTVRVNNRVYFGSFFLIGNIKAVDFVREQSANKQTTLKIRMAIENYINK